MTIASPALQEIIEPAVTALGYEFVGCEVIQDGKRCVLRVFADGPSGISIDAITQISRQISAVMDVEEPIRGRYDLEVSSPGLNRPLYALSHYERFVGKKVKLRLRKPLGEANRRHFSGVLEHVEKGVITLRMDDETVIDFDFEDIDKGNLVPEL